MALSNITLVVAEASGWYKPNYTLAEKLYWGRNRGCKFVKHDCVSGDTSTTSGPEFCTVPGENGCDLESTTPARCYTVLGKIPNPGRWNYYGNNIVSADRFTDNCATMSKTNKTHYCGPGGVSSGESPEFFGKKSACFKSGIVYEDYKEKVKGRCYEYKVR